MDWTGVDRGEESTSEETIFVLRFRNVAVVEAETKTTLVVVHFVSFRFYQSIIDLIDR